MSFASSPLPGAVIPISLDAAQTRRLTVAYRTYHLPAGRLGRRYCPIDGETWPCRAARWAGTPRFSLRRWSIRFWRR